MSGRVRDAVTLGPRRRRRKMSKRLAELDRIDRVEKLDPLDSIDKRLERLKHDARFNRDARFTREDALRLTARPKKQHRFGAFVTLVVFALAVTGVVLVARRSSAGHASAASNSVLGGNDNPNRNAPVALTPSSPYAPPPGVGEKRSRLLPVPTPPAGSGGYELAKTKAGVPVRYDPCRPIHYVIREQNTPAGGDKLIREAVAAVSKATGLKFIDDGTTTETPNLKRLAYQPARYGKRWAPVMIAWTNPDEISTLKGNIAGWGGSASYTTTDESGVAFVSGYAYLDSAQLETIMTAPSHNDAGVRAVIEHELGHVVGLKHVSDSHQLMYPSSSIVSGYADGDLRGLAIAGSGTCHPEL